MAWFVQSAPGKYGSGGRDPLDPLLEEQFEVLFGDEPGVGQPDRAAYEYAKKYFEGLAVPDFSGQMISAAFEEYNRYNFPTPVFFSQRGRLLARFPGTPIDWNPDAASAIIAPWQIICTAQVHLIKSGVHVDPIHPFVPAKFKEMNSRLS